MDGITYSKILQLKVIRVNNDTCEASRNKFSSSSCVDVTTMRTAVTNGMITEDGTLNQCIGCKRRSDVATSLVEVRET